MKKTILFLLFITTFNISNSFSQSKYLGLKYGVNQSKISIKEYDKNVYPYFQSMSSSMGQFIGLSYYNNNKKNYFLGLELIYSKRCFNNVVSVLDSIPNSINFNRNDHKIKTIELPLIVGKKFGNKFFVGLNLGLIPFYIFDLKIYDKSPQPHQVSDESNVINCDWQAAFFLGVKLRSHIMLQSEISYQHSILDLYKTQELNSNFYGKLQTINFAVKVSYKIKQRQKVIK